MFQRLALARRTLDMAHEPFERPSRPQRRPTPSEGRKMEPQDVSTGSKTAQQAPTTVQDHSSRAQTRARRGTNHGFP
eukprot:1854798-Pyramimonas_sp.AAC.1